MLTGKKIEEMRTSGLIPNVTAKTQQIFNEPLTFTETIKKNVFESDFGIYCDYYMTRQIMINNGQEIKDVCTESILLNLHLTEKEKKLYDKYDLRSYFMYKKHSY